MTNEELIAKIKGDIEMLKSIEYPCDNSQQATGFFNALDRMTDFLSTLESENPMKQEGLEDEAVSYCFDNGLNLSPRVATDFARHFAQWGAEHTPLPEDTVLFNKGVEEGKRLMMEEAVEGRVISNDGISFPVSNEIHRLKLMEGDKVKIIIVKEDEK